MALTVHGAALISARAFAVSLYMRAACSERSKRKAQPFMVASILVIFVAGVSSCSDSRWSWSFSTVVTQSDQVRLLIEYAQYIARRGTDAGTGDREVQDVN